MIDVISSNLHRTPKTTSLLVFILPLNIFGCMTSTIGQFSGSVLMLVIAVSISILFSSPLGVGALSLSILFIVLPVVLEIMLFVFLSPITHGFSNLFEITFAMLLRYSLAPFGIALVAGIGSSIDLVLVVFAPLGMFLKNGFFVFQKVLVSLVFSTGLALWIEAITLGFVAVKVIGRGREFLIAGRATFKGLVHLSTSLCFSQLRCEQAIARNCFSGATLAHTGYYTTKVSWLQGDIQI